MTRPGQRLAPLMLLFALVPTAVFCEESLVIGWSALECEDSGDGFGNAAVLVPRQLMAAVSFVSERYPTDEEFEASMAAESARTIEAARQAVAAARKKRDIASISIMDPARRSSELEAAETAVSKAEAALGDILAGRPAGSGPEASGLFLAFMPAAASPARRSVALEPWAGHAKGLLCRPTMDPGALCEAEGLDILVYGKLRPSGGYMAVTISVYVKALGFDVWTGSEYAAPDDLSSIIAALTRPLAEALLRKPYARVDYRVTPATATILVDGVAQTAAYRLYFEEGRHAALASARGFVDGVSSFDLRLGQDLVVELALEPVAALGVTIVSEPPGAGVYMDGERLGETPLVLDGKGYTRVARLVMPGYDDERLLLRPGGLAGEAAVTLRVADGMGFDEEFGQAKDRFYHALGWFVASLPVTVLSFGSFQTYYSTLSLAASGADIDQDTIDSLDTKFYTAQTVFWVSGAVSAGLAVNAVVSFVRYLQATQ